MFAYPFEQVEKNQGSGNQITNIFGVNMQIMQKNKLFFNKNRKQYYWNDFQQKRYIVFIKESLKLFNLSIREKKQLRLNFLMSKRVKTRNPAQCHTHHQKMLRKYKDIEGIIVNHLYLFNNQEVVEIKQILKEHFGEKMTIDQIIIYSKKLSKEMKIFECKNESYQLQPCIGLSQFTSSWRYDNEKEDLVFCKGIIEQSEW